MHDRLYVILIIEVSIPFFSNGPEVNRVRRITQKTPVSMQSNMLISVRSLLLVPVAKRMHKLVLGYNRLVTRISEVQLLLSRDTTNVRCTKRPGICYLFEQKLFAS